ncbi:5'-methylthioadenosine/S-adenosylhomocysteine nucleosidase [Aquabacterium sp. J223]|uniref:5'-methylthioadenosine/S-adenosylhomocysteine nucleosidase n=1 Tax=Aquabacterium sp. J223 TaxID=2898431 RepID=UPI0021ADE80A|nr:5'-methylthioadenosine/S-adenosylhomocysteine nucleosidase [Aquabacterium sp. J223]UUX96316.1 5'-methylthioadenosine/S-adenosylhomocysteine nucleosidase [Aquabacterium sp. J223]
MRVRPAALWCALVLGCAGLPPATARCLSDCTPRIGIVSAFGAEADLLVAQTRQARTRTVNGNRFTTGVLRGRRVVIVLSGVSMVNATMVTQLMLDHFRIERLVMSGIAGGVNPAHRVGDVTVPERWVMPMEVYWNGEARLPSACGVPGDLACLGLALARQPDGTPWPPYQTWYLRQNFVMTAANAPQGEYRFDYPVDAEMLAVARSLRPPLQRCGPRARTAQGGIDDPQCVKAQPTLVVGGTGVSGTAFLANADYRRYLFDTLGAQVVEMETAALAHVALANRVPYIAMRSVSDLAGAQDLHADAVALFTSGLAEANAAAVTLSFLEAWSAHQASKRRAVRPAPPPARR